MAEQANSREPPQDRLDLRDMRRLLRLLETHHVVEAEIEFEGGRIRRIRLRRSGEQSPATVPGTAASGKPANAAAAPAVAERRRVEISSPFPGTFYRAPKPDARPFVDVGDAVEPGMTVGIIEVMKMMNDVKSEVAGTITAILVENSESVEYGQLLFFVEPREG